MNPQTNHQSTTKIIVLSVLSGIRMIILSLILGTLLDYVVVQILSQYFLSDCSENCYFAYFNAIFFVLALLSLVVGFASGRRTYRKLSESS
jgi:uncharacterized membrane protein